MGLARPGPVGLSPLADQRGAERGDSEGGTCPPLPVVTIDAAERARVLVEALPYIKRFHGQKVVIKLGGHAMERKDETLLDIVLLRYVGLLPVLVHGGGPEITALSEKLGLKAEFRDGLRVTDAATMEVVKM